MMEFFLSKVWAFVVGIMLMGVLLQGVNMQAQSERSSAIKEVAENIQELFDAMGRAGPGLERTVDMSEVLPNSSTLTLTEDHATLEDGGKRRMLTISLNALLVESSSGQLETVEYVTLDQESVMMLVTDENGLTAFVFNPRTCPPGT